MNVLSWASLSSFPLEPVVLGDTYKSAALHASSWLQKLTPNLEVWLTPLTVMDIFIKVICISTTTEHRTVKI